MTAKSALATLGEVAFQAGVEIRVESLGVRGYFAALAGRSGRGGLCRIGGRPVILLEASLGPIEQATILGESLRILGLLPEATAEELRPVRVPDRSPGPARTKPRLRLVR